MSSKPSANIENTTHFTNYQYLEEPLLTRLRADLKKHYLHVQEAQFEGDLKYTWNGGSWMSAMTTLTPEILYDGTLGNLCNKATVFYWSLSAQNPRTNLCPRLVFADIYKTWWHCHDTRPDIDHGRFFTFPIRLTSTGPRTIPELLQAHAYMCDRAFSRIESIRSGELASIYWENRDWRRYKLLPLCRAIVVFYDEFLPPSGREPDGTLSLDKDAERQTAVMLLTGQDSGLSSPINFDALRSSSLPIARDDVDAIDSSNVIRVSLKTAVQFITKLQQREETASRSNTDNLNEPGKVDYADEYVEDVLDRPHESGRKQCDLIYVTQRIEMEKRGEYVLSEEGIGMHWPGTWI